jgi:hypothetical protein
MTAAQGEANGHLRAFAARVAGARSDQSDRPSFTPNSTGASGGEPVPLSTLHGVVFDILCSGASVRRDGHMLNVLHPILSGDRYEH